MAYTISLSNGTALLGSTGLPDGTVDSVSTSLALIGKNFPDYGVFYNENLVHLLENFANTSAPTEPLPGQLWFDSVSKVLKLNVSATKGSNNQQWKALAGITSKASRPDSGTGAIAATIGEFWWDTINNQLKVYSGLLSQGENGWITVGPPSNTSTGQSGAQPDTIIDSLSVSHVIIKFFLGGELVAILSKDPEFTPGTAVPGFVTVKPGLNLSTGFLANELQYHGNANVAYNLIVNGVPISGNNFVRSDVVTTSTVPIVTSNVGGLEIGPVGDFVINVSTSTSTVGMYNNRTNYDTVMFVKTSLGTREVFRANGTTGLLQVSSDPVSSLGVSTKQYVDAQIAITANAYLRRDGANTITGNIVPSANVLYNLGSGTSSFNTIFGQSIRAAYADLAERFESDAAYPAGTVVEIGGDREITAVWDELSENVLGVISTNAAYLMNSHAGDDATHPAIAIGGRVPVKVIGEIRKGDRLVSAGNGLARAGLKHELTPWNVIGRALEDKPNSAPGTIMAVVRINT